MEGKVRASGDERRPKLTNAGRQTWRKRWTASVLLAVGAVTTAAGLGAQDPPATARVLRGDPTGDETGTGDLRLDATSLGVSHEDGVLIVDVTFDGTIALPSLEVPSALRGFVDFDTDADAGTGATPRVDFATGIASGLGAERYAAFDSYDPSDGAVDLVDTASRDVIGRVPFETTPNALRLRVPEALLGATGPVRLVAGVGTEVEVNDAVPDAGWVELDAATAGGDVVLLNGGRFAVEIGWRDFAGRTGGAHEVFRSDDSAIFWFFRADNWEMLVKVLDGCANNGHYWVFAAATTNVEYTLKVTDTTTGAVRVYTNPLGTSSPSITDNRAFAACQ